MIFVDGHCAVLGNVTDFSFNICSNVAVVSANINILSGIGKFVDVFSAVVVNNIPFTASLVAILSSYLQVSAFANLVNIWLTSISTTILCSN